MEKKKILIVPAIILLIILGVSTITYAIYKASATGTSTIATSNFIIKANTTNIIQNQTVTLPITWTNENSAVSGKIAPGAEGTIPITIDDFTTLYPSFFNTQV